MSRILLTSLFVMASAAAQPVLSVTDALGNPGPFVRGQVLRVRVTTAPLRPLSLLGGSLAGSPLGVPGVSGALGISPSSLVGIAPYDGLGLFGGSLPWTANANGEAEASIQVPADFGAAQALPFQLALQVVVGVVPNATNPNLLAFSNTATATIAEPAAAVAVTSVSPTFWVQGSTAPLQISGTFVSDAAGVNPRVTFESVVSGLTEDALSVTTLGPATLLVTPPPILGGDGRSFGPVRIRVSYEGTGLFNPGSPNATTVTNPMGEADPTFLVWQSGDRPTILNIDRPVVGSGSAGSLEVTGRGFLPGARAILNPGSAGAVDLGGKTESPTRFRLDYPTGLPVGAGVLTVRNPDHVSASPREAPPNGSVTTLAVFPSDLVADGITVTAVAPTSIVEGSTGVTVSLDGTCSVIGGLSALDPRAGPPRVRIGRKVGGSDVSLAVAVTSVAITGPGMFRITGVLPPFPPGLNPLGPTTNGLGNAGVHSFQVATAPRLDPMGRPHQALGSIPTVEPGNRIVYRSNTAPVITNLLPNNVIRRDGGQVLEIQGAGFFSTGSGLPNSNPDLLGTVGLLIVQSGAPTFVPCPGFEVVNGQTLRAVTPDLTPWGLVTAAQVVVMNPDEQSTNPLASNADDLVVRDSLSPMGAQNPFPTSGVVVVDTGVAGAFNGPFVFPGDLVLDGGAVLRAYGSAPLIIRVRGDVTILGEIDLSGDAFATPPAPGPLPFSPPAGGGSGGPGSDRNLAQLGATGFPGTGPLDALTGLAFPSGGGGGRHSLSQAGGGGGGSLQTAGGLGLGMDVSGPTGGAAGSVLGLNPIPFSILGAGGGMEFLWPPGGGGGGAGGTGLSALPYMVPTDPSSVGRSGSGGNGGGGLLIAADGVIRVVGAIRANGGDGAAGQNDASQTLRGAGGGGGSGGAVVLVSLQGITIDPSAILLVSGGAGGSGGPLGGSMPPANLAQAGGAGGTGVVRLALPLNGTASPQFPPTLVPDTTGF